MKRVIKFRGKRADNGEWVLGFYMAIAGTYNILSANSDSPSSATYYEVIPSTVSQYTGLRDKNGVEIYDGDIISLRDYVAEVRWNNNISSFCIRFSFESELGVKPLGSWISGRRGCRVIGNLYDNPELLKR